MNGVCRDIDSKNLYNMLLGMFHLDFKRTDTYRNDNKIIVENMQGNSPVEKWLICEK